MTRGGCLRRGSGGEGDVEGERSKAAIGRVHRKVISTPNATFSSSLQLNRYCA